MSPANFQSLANFIWSVADLLRGPYRPPQYERVMLPMTVLRRFDGVLAFSKAQVLKKHDLLEASGKIKNVDATLNAVAKDENGNSLGFHNHSKLDFKALKGDPDNVGRHLQDYINGFSENIRKIFERFEFDKEIEKLEEANRLYLVVSSFAEIDLHPNRVDNITMGLVFEDLIRRFNELANETAGDHFTPREVIHLMVNLLMEPDGEVLTGGRPIVTVCDPACGTGGMLAEAQNWIQAHNENAIVKVFGQDYNPRSYAVAASDLLIKGHKDSRIEFGNTLTAPPFEDIEGFDYLLANPPFGVDWKAEQKEISRWKDFNGYTGKLPRVNDGALLFLLYMLSKRQAFQPSDDPQQNQRGTRIAIVFSEVTWALGAKGSKQKKFFRDCFTVVDPEAAPVIAKRGNRSGVVTAADLPNQAFPNDLEPAELDRVFGVFADPEGKKKKTVEYEVDANLRDTENVPLKEGIVAFFLREVRPYVGDAWINPDAKLRDESDSGIGKVGCEINFNREFFKYQPPRSLKEIDAELAEVEGNILSILNRMTT